MPEFVKEKETYDVQSGDTLKSIAAAHPDDVKDWKAIAFFNWGTDRSAEVNRALFETVGVSKVDPKKPEKTVLEPADGLLKKIRIPKTFSHEGLALNKKHVVKVKKGVTPAPAISISALDKWFIPKKEKCALGYSLEGPLESADKVKLEVFGSKYCEATDWKDGLGTFSELDEPVYERPTEEMDASPRKKVQISNWAGNASTENGVLQGEDRFINVVFSPYTVHFRYYKDDADETARLALSPFWPRFENDAPVADSLKVKWEVKNASRLKHGSLEIFDKDDTVVFRKALPEGDLSEGEHEFAWDGKENWDGDAGKSLDAPRDMVDGKMPYRVQLQAHTESGDEKGVALAAMHTEVRLYAHPDTRDVSVEDYDPAEDPQTLEFELGPLIPDEEEPERGDGTRWIQLQLAKAGYHPGPVDGEDREPYQIALKEFQRSRPKRRAGRTADYERLTPDASESGDTKDALEDVKDEFRPWFGKRDGSKLSDLDNKKAEKKLNEVDADDEMVLWVEDRQYYTETSKPGGDPILDATPETMSNPRSHMSIGDVKLDKDRECIPRPWIPLSVGLPLMSKKDDLDTELDPKALKSRIEPVAVGPVRVDWTFDECDVDISVLEPIEYSKDTIRTKAWLEWTLDQLKEADYERKDLKRTVTYANCPEANGGIRGAVADYFKQAFGLEDEGLNPWYSVADAETESVASVVHSDFGDRTVQAEESLFKNALGRAGAFFRPSFIAGDGYRVRAQVRFKDTGDYALPNQEALEARYSRLPQANTRKIRVWRKTSIRGYVGWVTGKSGNWPSLAGADVFPRHYRAAHVHLVHESGSPRSWAIGDLIDLRDNAVMDDIKNMLRDTVTKDFLKDTDSMKLSTKHVWPWAHLPCLGWPIPAPPGTTEANKYKNWYLKSVIPEWRKYRARLLHELVRGVERKTDLMRGHLLVEFSSSPKFWVEAYWCDTCQDGTDPRKFWYFVSKVGAGEATGRPCSNPAGCDGRMQSAAAGFNYTGSYVCDTCGVKRTKKKDSFQGSAFVGEDCSRRKCGGALIAKPSYLEEYECASCARKATLNESGPGGGSHTGDACTAIQADKKACGGLLQRQQGRWERYVCSDAPAAPEDEGCTRTTELPTGVIGTPFGVCGCGEALAHRTDGGADEYDAEGSLSVGTKLPKATKKSTTYVFKEKRGFPFPAVGSLVGATWLFDTGEDVVWTHEIGHHRHLQHASNAPGSQDAQHDSEDSPFLVNHEASNPGTLEAREQQWDLQCIMNGYSHVVDRADDFFCGKCVLKNRGWSVEALPNPGGAVKDA